MASGTLRKRGHQKYQVRIRLGTDPTTGKRIRYEKTFHGSLKDAKKYLRDLLSHHDKGGAVRSSQEPLQKYLHRWLETAKKKKLAHKTHTGYKNIIDKHFAGRVGKIPIGELTPILVQEFYSGLEGGRSLLHQIHTVLNGALKQAVRWQLLVHNPCDSVERPTARAKKTKKDIRAFNRDQADAFLTAAKLDRWSPLWQLLLSSGMRPQEAFGLQWPELELDERVVRIVHALTRPPGGGWSLDPCKTDRSRRSLVLPKSVIAALRDWKVRQLEERMAYSGAYEDHGFVFATRNGSPLLLSNLRKRHFLKVLKAAGLPSRFRIYDLRHSCATLLLLRKVPPKVVSERLGHNSVTLTLDTYSSVLPTMQEMCADELEATGLF